MTSQMTSTSTVIKRLLESSAQFPIKLHNFIDNEFENTKEKMESINPSTGELFFYLNRSGKAEADRAVAAAKRAFESWSQTSPQYRSSILLKAAQIIEDNLDDMALLESRDQGKPVWLAKAVDIPRCIHNLRFFANSILHHTDPSILHHSPSPGLSYVVRDPVGVSVLISPWNLPIYLLSFKIAPAIATGNTVVCKPSELTSATAYVLMHALFEAGLPKGVVNMVLGTGAEVGEHLVTNPDVGLVSFTGSTLIGKKIASLAAQLNKKTSLEMGGKNGCIVCPSADLPKVIPDIVRSCFINQGEVCLCTSRLFVHKSIFDNFLGDFLEEAKKYTVGDPESGAKLGAVNSKIHFDKVMSYIKIASEEGGKIELGGRSVQPEGRCNGGYFIQPTVISGLTDDSRCMKEEIFGPVVCIVPFETNEEVIKRANSTSYGLSATVFSQNVNEIHSIARSLRVGTVWCNTWMLRDLNMPFGGTKDSGMGREGGEDSLHFFTEQKTICLKIN
ncbi:alh-10 [Pristionchus pacificus]|nr:alh-10 [Pristionchus pacificus]